MGFRYSTWMFFTLALLCLLFLDVSPTEAQQLAFPGAEGYGSYSKGGRGGEIVRVTTLNDSGPGSLRAAVEREGPRVVMFEVGGVVNLESELVIDNPYITIAGETAPVPGITIRGNRLIIQKHDVIIRFIRFRPGDVTDQADVDYRLLDAVSILNRDEDAVHDIILDHCSFSWGADENIGIWENTKRVTIQNSIISEGLHRNRHNPGSTGQGLLIGMDATDISILRNLFAHNFERNPYINTNGRVDFRNNIIYNGGERIMRFFNARGEKQRVNLVNNLIVRGPDSTYDREIFIRLTSRSRMYNGQLFLEGNRTDRNQAASDDNWLMVKDEESGEPFSLDARAAQAFPVVQTSTLPTQGLIEQLNHQLGAVLPVRDQVDQRVMNELGQRRGSHISTVTEVLGWPTQAESHRSIDDLFAAWEAQTGVDLLDTGLANQIDKGEEYTNLELFLHELASDENRRAGAEDHFLSGEAGALATTGGEQKEGFEVGNNFPNPFHGRTTIKLQIHSPDEYRLDVYDSRGRRVHQLMDRRELIPGEYEIQWNAEQLTSGIYFLRLHSPRKMRVQKMTFIR